MSKSTLILTAVFVLIGSMQSNAARHIQSDFAQSNDTYSYIGIMDTKAKSQNWIIPTNAQDCEIYSVDVNRTSV